MGTDHVERLAADLAALGVVHAFGVAGGGSSLRLISALESLGVSYHPVAHECAGGLMAGACSTGGEVRAVAVTIKGPGFVNLAPAMLANTYEGRAALTVSEAYGPQTPPFRMHKRADHRGIAGSIVKAYGCADGETGTVESIFDIATAEVPGPVHLDVFNDPAPAGTVESCGVPAPGRTAGSVDRLIELVERAERPAVVLGSCAARLLGGAGLNGLRVPVATTAAAKGAFDETSPYAAGVITGEVKDLSPENAVLGKADLVVGIGLRNTEVVSPRPFGPGLVIVDVVGGGLHDGFGADEAIVVDDISAAAAKVVEALADREWGSDLVEKRNDTIGAALFAEPWLPPSVFTLTQQTLGDAALVLDTGLFCTVGETVWRAKSPEGFCGSSVGRFMGTSVPTAIGVAVSRPGQRVVCVAGDGGIRPYISELRLAVEEKLPILFLLMKDGRYGTVASGARGVKVAARAYEIGQSWWKAVEAMGCPSAMVDGPDALSSALAGWTDGAGPLFLEMDFDPDRYMAMTERLR